MKLRFCLVLVTILLTSSCNGLRKSGYSLPDIITPGGTVYYVRLDGGSALQCNGLSDSPYTGTGLNQECAWDHPFRALPPGGPPRIAGGDTVIIASGSYRLGSGSPGADSPALCNANNPWDCTMPPIPSGPDPEHPTRILGQGWDSGCIAPPHLWGAEHSNHLFNLTRTSNTIIACLELTDHATCAEGHPDSNLSCQRGSHPYGDWASVGIYAEDADNILLRDLDIHGLAYAGIHGGRLSNWRVEHTRLAGNGWLGWDGDLIQGSDANSGTLVFSNWLVEWNGCVESYPEEQPTGCWAQPAGGYGDGVSTGVTAGHWIIEDSTFLHNTSDGLDLLNASNDALIEIRRCRAEGNAGNQIKVSGSAEIENTIVVGNCAFFNGKPFTASGDYDGDGLMENAVMNCRAEGNALSFDLWRGKRVKVTNSSLTGEGDCLIFAQCARGVICEGTERVILQNNLFIGQTRFTDPSMRSCLAWSEDLPDEIFEINFSSIYGVKDTVCPGRESICEIDPLVVSTDINAFSPQPVEGSPLLDAARQLSCPAMDYLGRFRPQGSGCDIGAYELPVGDRFFLPLIEK